MVRMAVPDRQKPRRYPGSTHDSYIFRHSGIHTRLLAGEFGEGYLLGDSAYEVRTYMMMPYLNPATPAERRYNSAHRATRNVVERTFGLLKSRLRCIHKSGGALQYSPDTTCRIVATCAILHNIATTRGIPVEISEPDSDEDYDHIPPLQRADRTSAAEGRQRRADITHNHFRCK
ncbi:hypothetical protein NDU88_003955 [Pleurodeles waltl]|uniref:DDE Tnp4 domain-containing protein n=1 Tax=Pleurodeles waltl TaxID=8319 RepID=A0AAV7UF56_PLEWA|nr:hypothetical protein NDU88_003955 [Pleurodeles waltl]